MSERPNADTPWVSHTVVNADGTTETFDQSPEEHAAHLEALRADAAAAQAAYRPPEPAEALEEPEAD